MRQIARARNSTSVQTVRLESWSSTKTTMHFGEHLFEVSSPCRTSWA